MAPLESLSDEILIESLRKAKIHQLDQEFINLLEIEVERRQLNKRKASDRVEK